MEHPGGNLREMGGIVHRSLDRGVPVSGGKPVVVVCIHVTHVMGMVEDSYASVVISELFAGRVPNGFSFHRPCSKGDPVTVISKTNELFRSESGGKARRGIHRGGEDPTSYGSHHRSGFIVSSRDYLSPTSRHVGV